MYDRSDYVGLSAAVQRLTSAVTVSVDARWRVPSLVITSDNAVDLRRLGLSFVVKGPD